MTAGRWRSNAVWVLIVLALPSCDTLKLRGSAGERGIHDIKIGIPI